MPVSHRSAFLHRDASRMNHRADQEMILQQQAKAGSHSPCCLYPVMRERRPPQGYGSTAARNRTAHGRMVRIRHRPAPFLVGRKVPLLSLTPHSRSDSAAQSVLAQRLPCTTPVGSSVVSQASIQASTASGDHRAGPFRRIPTPPAPASRRQPARQCRAHRAPGCPRSWPPRTPAALPAA